jgi:dihydrofolate reductase
MNPLTSSTTSLKVTAVLAINKSKHLYGVNGCLPWGRHFRDLVEFRKRTINGIVIMGRRTFDSLGRKPLPGRYNIVITAGNDFSVGTSIMDGNCDIHFFAAPHLAVEFLEQEMQASDGIFAKWCAGIFVIGGINILRMFMPIVSEVYESIIDYDDPSLDKNGTVSQKIVFPSDLRAQYCNWKHELLLSYQNLDIIHYKR